MFDHANYFQVSLIFASKARAYSSGAQFGAPYFVLTPGASIIKLIKAVIYGFRNKLECLTLNTRLGWKGLLGTTTLPFYGNLKLRQ